MHTRSVTRTPDDYATGFTSTGAETATFLPLCFAGTRLSQPGAGTGFMAATEPESAGDSRPGHGDVANDLGVIRSQVGWCIGRSMWEPFRSDGTGAFLAGECRPRWAAPRVPERDCDIRPGEGVAACQTHSGDGHGVVYWSWLDPHWEVDPPVVGLLPWRWSLRTVGKVLETTYSLRDPARNVGYGAFGDRSFQADYAWHGGEPMPPPSLCADTTKPCMPYRAGFSPMGYRILDWQPVPRPDGSIPYAKPGHHIV